MSSDKNANNQSSQHDADYHVGRRQLYILPTRIGWYYALILIALFGIAVKFDNQAAFMMLFILISVSLIAMVYTHNNVIGLSINVQTSKSVFVGDTATFPVHLYNNSNKDRYAVWLACGGFTQLNNLRAGEQAKIDLRLPSVQRGYLNCEPISLTSQFPIGVFFCWTKQFHSLQRCLVYPQPLDLVPLQAQDIQQGKQQSQPNITSGGEDYSGMKSYQPGDRLRDIHWPSLAKTQKLVSIQHENQNSSSVNLSWFSLPKHLTTEDKLSQLCHWVINAEQMAQRYQLEMPNHTIEYNNGLTHYHQCLSTLALWSETERSEAKEAEV